MSSGAKVHGLRYGYTTGTCAAAAARGAVMALVSQETVPFVEIDIIGGALTSFAIHKCVIESDRAFCSVIKDAGDDPDSTDGAEIGASAVKTDKPGIIISGGKGVGKVTKPGLEIPVGMAAINPVPRRMIEKEVLDVLDNQSIIMGVEIIITVTDGEKLAKKTLNPRLGIVGGISIIGTTGIVVPYSIDAYKASITQSISIAAACGCSHIVLTTGRRSEKYAQAELPLPEECFIQAGDFIGYSLEECAKKRISRVTVWGMTGKISKLAAGFMYTNISDSKVDMVFLAGIAAELGISEETIRALKKAATANHLRRLLPTQYTRQFCDTLCRLAAEQCRENTGGHLAVDCIMSDYNGDTLGRYHAR